MAAAGGGHGKLHHHQRRQDPDESAPAGRHEQPSSHCGEAEDADEVGTTNQVSAAWRSSSADALTAHVWTTGYSNPYPAPVSTAAAPCNAGCTALPSRQITPAARQVNRQITTVPRGQDDNFGFKVPVSLSAAMIDTSRVSSRIACRTDAGVTTPSSPGCRQVTGTPRSVSRAQVSSTALCSIIEVMTWRFVAPRRASSPDSASSRTPWPQR